MILQRPLFIISSPGGRELSGGRRRRIRAVYFDAIPGSLNTSALKFGAVVSHAIFYVCCLKHYLFRSICALLPQTNSFKWYHRRNEKLNATKSPLKQNVVSISQYVTKASSTVRAALKEPAKSKAMTQETYFFNKSTWTNGVQGPKTSMAK